MKIVILDAHTSNPGDLSWQEIANIGELEVYERTSPEEVTARAGGAEAILTNKTVIDSSIIESLPNLKYIGVLATGTNVVDLDAARQRGIDVTNIPAYSTPSVSQTVFALLLQLTNQVALHSHAVRKGEWTNCNDFCFTKSPLVELSGKTLGIFGYGGIGSMTASVGRAFGMKIIATARTPKQVDGVDFVSNEEIFSRSDVISLHCPLTPETEHLVNAEHLGLMKESAFLINTGRGGLVDEQALADGLNSGRIAGAGLDVLSTEPPAADNPLLKAKNCVITPHIAWATQESRARLISAAAENLTAFTIGQPVNVVNA